mmetsp:Transcript_9290/g.14895  ORF Transcript_9290/g.14895 Transcript_9290/m.14895 type:complete len:602 (+) Transcript_9290:61-1866(+)
MMEQLNRAADHQLGGGDMDLPQEFSKDTTTGASSRGSLVFESFEKLQVDFDSSDLALENALDQIGQSDEELEKMLVKEATETETFDRVPAENHQSEGEGGADGVSDINLDQMNLGEIADNISLAGSESSMDKLMSMNIIEVDDPVQARRKSERMSNGFNSDVMQEFAKGFLAAEDNNNNNYNPDMHGTGHQQQGYDTLLGNLSGNRGYAQQQQQPYMQQQYDQQQYDQQGPQMMMNQMNMHHNQQQQMQHQMHHQHQQQRAMINNSGMDPTELNAAKFSQLQQMDSNDLEREKMKLLSRLQEINSRQGAASVMQQQPQGLTRGPGSSGVASVMGNEAANNGETPLQRFLRGKNAGSATPSKAGGPAASSVLDASPMDFGGSSNPFLRQAAGGKGTPLVAAMNKSSTSQDMIRNTLSGRSLQASGVSLRARSGGNIMDILNTDVDGGQTKNATWGASGVSSRNPRNPNAYYTSSGILSKHNVSDGHLLQRGTMSASLAKSKNRVGSLSRENSLYNLMKSKQGSHKNLNSMARQGSHQRLGSLTKSGSKNSLMRDSSFGSLLPTKRGGRTNTKHKLGGSLSVPHMAVRAKSPTTPSNHGNAMW